MSEGELTITRARKSKVPPNFQSARNAASFKDLDVSLAGAADCGAEGAGRNGESLWNHPSGTLELGNTCASKTYRERGPFVERLGELRVQANA
jgi:hypothetical protein